MSKAKMLAAKELIKEKRYADARRILKTVDHPKATEWLDALDLIAPERTLFSIRKLLTPNNLILLVSIAVILAVVGGFIHLGQYPIVVIDNLDSIPLPELERRGVWVGGSFMDRYTNLPPMIVTILPPAPMVDFAPYQHPLLASLGQRYVQGWCTGYRSVFGEELLFVIMRDGYGRYDWEIDDGDQERHCAACGVCS